MSSPHRSEEETTTILMALIAWAGNCSKAARYLKSEKGIAISATSLRDWKVRHGERYDELRERYRDQLENNLANEMRDVARLAVEVEKLALEKARTKLNAGEEPDPSRAAANLARVAQSSTDKVMTLTSRPVSITENRDPSQVVAGLIAKYPQIFGLTEEPKQLKEPPGPEV